MTSAKSILEYRKLKAAYLQAVDAGARAVVEVCKGRADRAKWFATRAASCADWYRFRLDDFIAVG